MPPNTRVQRTRSSPSAHREPLTRRPLGRHRAALLEGILAVLAILSVVAVAAGDECARPSYSFDPTNGGAVFSAGSPERLRKSLSVSITVRDGEDQCALIKRKLISKLSKAFPSWRFVADGAAADLRIVYESSFSICVDDCDPQTLPQNGNAELVLDGGSLQAHWSDYTHWRSRTRLVALFVEALKKAVDG